MATPLPDDEQRALHHERRELLHRIEDWLETPMLVLGAVWLVLLGVELLRGLSPELELLSMVIWVIFILDFLLKFFLAPDKTDFLRGNIITLISLLLPALRVLRFARVLRLARAARSLRLVKVVGSINRGMRALSASMGRRGVGYVLGLTALVLLVGAAGMYAFERDEQGGLQTYPEALWWTAMLLISIGSEYWPRSLEGRALCFLLALYGFAVFGYFTATLASFFVGRDAESGEGEVSGANQIMELQTEIRELRADLREVLRQRPPAPKN